MNRLKTYGMTWLVLVALLFLASAASAEHKFAGVTATGTVTGSTLGFSSNIKMNGDVIADANGITSTNGVFSGTLAVTGASTLTGNTTVGGTLGVTGAVTHSSTLGVTGLITATGGLTSASDITLTGSSSIIDMRFENAASDARTAVGGAYYDTDDNRFYIYGLSGTGSAGSSWVKLYSDIAGDQATTSARGLMSAADKTSLDDLVANMSTMKSGTYQTVSNETSKTIAFATAFAAAPIVNVDTDKFISSRVAATRTTSFDVAFETNPNNAKLYWQASGALNP